MFKAPKSRRPVSMMDSDQGHEPPPVKRYRTSEDFLYFCTLILEHEGYEPHKEDPRRRNTSSPLGSTGSTGSLSNDSFKSFMSNKDDLESQDGKSTSDADTDDSYDQVTCYCGKPFAGRSMIECSSCLTWVHFKCANIKRTKIPEHWYCQRCIASNAISTNKSASRKRRKPPVRRPVEQAA